MNETYSSSAPYQKDYSNVNSINQIKLREEFRRFWEPKEEWDSAYVLKENHAIYIGIAKTLLSLSGRADLPDHIYLPALHASLLSTNMEKWDANASSGYGADISFSEKYLEQKGEIKNTQKSARKAKESYEKASKNFLNLKKYSELNVGENIDSKIVLSPLLLLFVPTFSVMGPVPFLLSVSTSFLSDYLMDIAANAPGAFDYSSHWRHVMGNQTDALEASAGATNKVFSDAQERAKKLEEMGADNDIYSGKAKPAYNEWANFVALAAKYSDPDTPYPASADSAQKYARVYRSLAIFEMVCEEPGHLPLFNHSSANIADAYNLMSGENSIIETGIEFERSLAEAEKIMVSEVVGNKSYAENLKGEVKNFEKFAKSNNYELFSYWDDFDDTPSPMFVAARATGTIPGLYSQFEGHASSGNSYFDGGKAISAKSKGWAAFRMHYYNNASRSYLHAMDAAYEMNESMHEKSKNACIAAEEKFQLLESKISEAERSNELGQSLSLVYALQYFEKANQSMLDAKQHSSLGLKYDLCKKVLYNSNIGIEKLESPEKHAENEDIENALKKFQEFIDAGEGMEVDISSYQAKHDSLNSLYKKGFEITLDEINSQIMAIQSELHARLLEENEKYLKLHSNAEAIKEENPAALENFENEFEKLREADKWSLYAFQHLNELNLKLKKQEESMDKDVRNAINSVLCKNANWISSDNSPPVSLKRLDTGGEWASSNTLNLYYPNNLLIECPFDIPFQFREVQSANSNIENSYSTEGKIHISLSSIDAFEKVSLSFTSSKIPFQHTQTSCLFEISKEGKAGMEANYSLTALYPPSSLKIGIPWPASGSSGEATLIASEGEEFEGVWAADSDGNDVIYFIISNFNPNINSFSIKILLHQPYLLEKQNYIITPSPSSPPTLGISYLLPLTSLPQCENAVFEVDEHTFSKLENFKLSSDKSKIKHLDTRYVGGIAWTAQLTPVPEDGQALVSVSYNINEPEEWLNSTLSILRQKAVYYNDSVSLEMADVAQKAFDGGETKTAYEYIEKLQSRLSSQVIDDGKARKAWEEEGEQASRLLLYLQNLSALNSSFAEDLNDWHSALSTFLSDANSLAAEGEIEKANIKWRSAYAKTEEKAKKKANSEYNELYSKSLELYEAIQLLGLDEQISSESDEALSKAQASLQKGEIFPAFQFLIPARQKLEPSYSDALSSAQQKFEMQNTRKEEILSKAQEADSLLTSYLNSLSILNSAGKYFTQPSLSEKEAKALQKSVQAIFSKWEEETPSSLSSALQSIQQREFLLSEADGIVLDAKAKADDGFSSISYSAKNLRRTAYLAIERLRSIEPDSTHLSSLDEDLQSLDSLISNEKYADAIPLAESIIKRAEKLAPEEGQLDIPLDMIALTLLLIIVLAYILISKKPPKQQQEGKPSETRKLTKTEEEGKILDQLP
ncbi:MAG: hypothetical protein ABIH83_05365 [Candidatus Micrarchaeota archaeon]